MAIKWAVFLLLIQYQHLGALAVEQAINIVQFSLNQTVRDLGGRRIQ